MDGWRKISQFFGGGSLEILDLDPRVGARLFCEQSFYRMNFVYT
jgi:hypothetical protein